MTKLDQTIIKKIKKKNAYEMGATTQNWCQHVHGATNSEQFDP